MEVQVGKQHEPRHAGVAGSAYLCNGQKVGEEHGVTHFSGEAQPGLCTALYEMRSPGLFETIEGCGLCSECYLWSWFGGWLGERGQSCLLHHIYWLTVLTSLHQESKNTLKANFSPETEFQCQLCSCMLGFLRNLPSHLADSLDATWLHYQQFGCLRTLHHVSFVYVFQNAELRTQ